MGAVLSLIVLAIIVIIVVAVIWAGIEALFGKQTTLFLRAGYSVAFILAAVGSYLTTFRYDYYINQNTHVYGWPMCTVIFQRHNLSSPWLDFVGVISLLAWPINFCLYLCLPSIIILAGILSRTVRARRLDLTLQRAASSANVSPGFDY